MASEAQTQDGSAGSAEVDGRLLRIAKAFTGDSWSRYILNGVFLEPHPEGVLMVATDGAALIVMLDRSGTTSRPAIVQLSDRCLDLLRQPSRVAFALCEGRKGSTGSVTVTGDDGASRVIAIDHDAEIDGDYVDWRKVAGLAAAQCSEASQDSLLSAKYLGLFAKAARRFNRAGFNEPGKIGLRIRSHGLDAAVIGFEKDVPAIGIFMPLKDAANGLPELPEWFLAFMPNTQQAAA